MTNWMRTPIELWGRADMTYCIIYMMILIYLLLWILHFYKEARGMSSFFNPYTKVEDGLPEDENRMCIIVFHDGRARYAYYNGEAFEGQRMTYRIESIKKWRYCE